MKKTTSPKRFALLSVFLVMVLAYGTSSYAGDIGDEAAQTALDKKAATDAANAKAKAIAIQKEKDHKAEETRKANALAQKEKERKAEETRKANAAEAKKEQERRDEANRIAALQHKCEKRGGDWKRGKCVMPPPEPKPVTVIKPPVSTVATSLLVAQRMVTKQKCNQEGGVWKDGVEQSTIGTCSKIESPIAAPSDVFNNQLQNTSGKDFSSTVMCGSAARSYSVTDISYPPDTVFCDMGITTPTIPAFPTEGKTVVWTCTEGNEAPVNCFARKKAY